VDTSSGDGSDEVDSETLVSIKPRAAVDEERGEGGIVDGWRQDGC